MKGIELDVSRASDIRRHLSKLIQLGRLTSSEGAKVLELAMTLQQELTSLVKGSSNDRETEYSEEKE